MAKATKKYHYYVIIFTNTGCVYVTGFGEGHYAKWERSKKPMEVSKSMAEDMVKGLTWNGYSAQIVQSLWEIEHQAYRYECGAFEWKSNQ